MKMQIRGIINLFINIGRDCGVTRLTAEIAYSKYQQGTIVKTRRVGDDIKAYVLEVGARGELRKWNRTKRRPGSLMNSACYTRLSRGLYSLPTNTRRLEFASAKHQMINIHIFLRWAV